MKTPNVFEMLAFLAGIVSLSSFIAMGIAKLQSLGGSSVVIWSYYQQREITQNLGKWCFVLMITLLIADILWRHTHRSREVEIPLGEFK